MTTIRRSIPILLLCLLLCVCLAPAAFADGTASGHTAEALQNAITGGKSAFTLDGDMTIPAGADIDAGGICIEVPSTRTLTVEGAVHSAALILNPQSLLKLLGSADFSTVTLNGEIATFSGAALNIFEELTDLDGGRPNGILHVDDGTAILIEAKKLDRTKLHEWTRFHSTESGAVTLCYTARSDDGFAGAVGSAQDLPEHFFGRVMLIYPCQMRKDMDLASGKPVELAVNGPRGGSLEIAAGVKLTAPSVILRDAALTVNGALESDGEIQLLMENGTASVLTVNGQLFPHAVTVGKGCTLSAAENSVVDMRELSLGGTAELRGRIFRVNDKFSRDGGTVEVHGGAVYFPAADILPDNAGVFSYPEGTRKVVLLMPVESEDDFAAAVETSEAMAENFIADINIFTPVTLSGQYVFTRKTELRVNGGSLDMEAGSLIAYNSGGSVFFNNGASVSVSGELNTNGIAVESGSALTVEKGGVVKTNDTLTVSRDSLVTVNGQLHITATGCARVAGTLENNSFVNILKRRNGSDPRLIIESTGLYLGSGRIDVKDPDDTDGYFSGLNLACFERMTDAYGTQYFPLGSAPALILPAGLTEIGAEAFSGGTFASVYIPAGVTVIDPTAFAGMEALTIYGAADSAAEKFAADKGFSFIVYP